VAADGGGPSLVIVNPAGSPDDPANWTTGKTGGTPGFGESTPFEDWLPLYPDLTAPADREPTADPDGDGMDNWSEFAFGLDPDDAASVNPITAGLRRTTASFSYSRRDPLLTGLIYKVWTSPDLDAWTEDDAVVETVVDLGDGKQSVTITLGAGAPLAAERLFVRVTAE
jgi:hypothetical protein